MLILIGALLLLMIWAFSDLFIIKTILWIVFFFIVLVPLILLGTCALSANGFIARH